MFCFIKGVQNKQGLGATSPCNSWTQASRYSQGHQVDTCACIRGIDVLLFRILADAWAPSTNRGVSGGWGGGGGGGIGGGGYHFKIHVVLHAASWYDQALVDCARYSPYTPGVRVRP
jgi:hypothetical protein